MFYEGTNLSNVLSSTNLLASGWILVANTYHECQNSYNGKKISVKASGSDLLVSYDGGITQAQSINIYGGGTASSVNALINTDNIIISSTRGGGSGRHAFVGHLGNGDSSYYKEMIEQNIILQDGNLWNDSLELKSINMNILSLFGGTDNNNNLFAKFHLIIKSGTDSGMYIGIAKGLSGNLAYGSIITSTHHVGLENFSLLSNLNKKKFKI